MNKTCRRCLWTAATLVVVGAGVDRVPAPTVTRANEQTIGQSASGLPPFTGQVTFLYFNDVDKAAAFYGGTLGLRKTFDAGWVRIFAISPSSSVALVDAAKGAHRASEDKPVTLAIVVADRKDVDRWYEHLKSQKVSIHMPPFDAPSVNVREFRFTDPEGYSLEIFAWLEKPGLERR